MSAKILWQPHWRLGIKIGFIWCQNKDKCLSLAHNFLERLFFNLQIRLEQEYKNILDI